MPDNTPNRQPLVSIIVPVYNGADYLREAIDSALNQTYPKCEVIVVNDGSTDNGATRDIALSFHDRIKYIEKENGGVATALNMGIQQARGEYISWLSHDDLYYPDKIDKQINFVNTCVNPNAVIYSDYETLEVETNIISQHAIRHLTPCNQMQATFVLLLTGSLHGCTFLLPSKLFTEVGYFDPRLRTTQDYEMWFRVLKSGHEFIHFPEVVVRARHHKNQGSRAMKDVHCAEHTELHIKLAHQFFEDIVTFPLRIVLNVIAHESGSCKESAAYIVDRIRKEKPSLHRKMVAYKVLACAKNMVCRKCRLQ
jgi:glycosyltransferase involved in cell wall biosynthesis